LRIVVPPPTEDDWVELSSEPLNADAAIRWAVLPSCGAQVLFSGTVRDQAEGRSGVIQLEYEVYAEAAEARLAAIAAEARQRWPEVGRIALLHRCGVLQVGECSVIVVVSAPHREAAFEVSRWCIDTLKATVPIWKRETWDGGVGWGTDASDIASIKDEGRVPS
jgi:molybdopterin synthase catalytic subunit